MSEEQTRPACSYCGSHDIVGDAAVYWDMGKREWCVSDTYGGVCCNCCGLDSKSHTDTLVPEAGTIIHGTLRMQDLLPAFLACLQRINPVRANYLAPKLPGAEFVAGLSDDDAWWDGESAQVAFETVCNELDEESPYQHYFGAHPGDGSDFGFWPAELLEDA